MQFVATERAKQGTGASRRLRLSGKTPGIVYGAGEAQLIEIDHNALWHAVHKEAFHSSILDMEINGQVTKVVLRDVQFHPYKKLVQHIDFQVIDTNKGVVVEVPLHVIGDAVDVRHHDWEVNQLAFSVTLEALPAKIPTHITIDISDLKVGGTIRLGDLQLPDGVQPGQDPATGLVGTRAGRAAKTAGTANAAASA